MKHCLVALALLGLCARQAETSESTAWKAAATKRGLDEQAMAQLEKDRILVVDEAFKQVFSVYLGGGSVFITSDSLLNAYHLLYEETIFRLENTNAQHLPQFLRTIMEKLDEAGTEIEGDPKLLEAARKRARLVCGIALRLADESFQTGNKQLDAILADECARIEKGNGQRMPKWLGTPSPSFMGIDYNRYKPRGFYTRTEKLSRYFRAFSWLQSIPFRISQDEELLAMLLLSEAAPARYETDLIDYSLLLGRLDNLDVFSINEYRLRVNLDSGELDKMRMEYADQAQEQQTGKINDTEPAFRILSAYQTPSAMLFEQTTSKVENRALPTGLEVAAALGSAHARKLLADSNHNLTLETIDANADLFQEHVFTPRRRPRGYNLYGNYLHVLRALTAPAEPAAPVFINGDAWQTKSINTLLGSWVQMRHTWALQAKQSMSWMCGSGEPAGFVEPNPEFFARMANLAYGTKSTIERCGALEADYSLAAENLRIFEKKCGAFQTEDEFLDFFHDQSNDDQSVLLTAYALMHVTPSEAKYGSAQLYRENVAWLKIIEHAIETGDIGAHPEALAMLESINGNLPKKWDDLERMSRQLEAIAHKQLRNLTFNGREEQYIRNYGHALANLMFHEGNSYVNPRDDAPKIVDVYSNINTGQHLHVGIARPRKLHVLYPWQGKTILCTGALLPYYEFAHPTRLNDAEWKTMLGSTKWQPKRSLVQGFLDAFKPKEPAPPSTRPAVPEWIKPILQGDGLAAPEFRD
ncbi:hypothetical protein PDESU_02864 [Pontiella desulfatans]|uniref:DUF3160 domain-containing protein n=1 Tax=Pontiella desulfatans TaxID=2750659 RepID=A0A6C2U363_PONDE|nr:DUF3160 domain-containing protein [Pontiella desulfatans]VGO14305.1 hypothetical protein PDESU_02864 [Pontiella desulfatans]